MRPLAAPWLVVVVWLQGCALGVGAMNASGMDGLVKNSDRQNGTLMVGAYAGMMPSATFTFPEGLPMGTALSWTAQAGANVYVRGIGGTVEYQRRYDEVNYAGGVSGGSALHGVMGYFGLALLPALSVDLGGGGLFGGGFGLLGSCGTVFDECTGAYVGEASGVRIAGRVNLTVFGPSSFWGTLYGTVKDQYGNTHQTSGEGPIIPITSSVRLEVGYQRIEVRGPTALPRAVGALNVGVQLMLGLF